MEKFLYKLGRKSNWRRKLLSIGQLFFLGSLVYSCLFLAFSFYELSKDTTAKSKNFTKEQKTSQLSEKQLDGSRKNYIKKNKKLGVEGWL